MFPCVGSLSHNLAKMSREVLEIKMPLLCHWFKKIDRIRNTFLETLLTGEKIGGDFRSHFLQV